MEYKEMQIMVQHSQTTTYFHCYCNYNAVWIHIETKHINDSEDAQAYFLSPKVHL